MWSIYGHVVKFTVNKWLNIWSIYGRTHRLARFGSGFALAVKDANDATNLSTVCAREREREAERESMCLRERECVCSIQRENVCVYVCV